MIMTAMKSDVDNAAVHEEMKAVCDFLSDYVSSLFGCAATCMRIEKNVGRIAEAYGKDVECVVFASHVTMTLWDKDHTHSYSNTVKARPAGISFNLNTKLSRLSWEIADRQMSLEEARTEYDRIVSERPIGRHTVLLLASLANMSFCYLFGGDAPSMGIVFCATFLGFYLKQIMLADGADIKLATLASAFIASVAGSAGYVFSIGATPELALATSVLYLIPGVPYINSVSDLLDGHMLTAMSRFIHAAVLTVCISLGLCGGIFLMQLRCF